MKVFLIFSELTVINVTHTHTHLFNGPFSGTTQLSRYQKDKTNLDYTEARDSEWQWHQLGRMQVCTSLQQITTSAPHRSVFYRPDALPAAQPTASKLWRHKCNWLINVQTEHSTRLSCEWISGQVFVLSLFTCTLCSFVYVEVTQLIAYFVVHVLLLQNFIAHMSNINFRNLPA